MKLQAFLLNSLSLISQIACSKSDKVIVGYFTDWTTGALPPEKVPFDKITHINYAFALPTESGDITLGSGGTLKTLTELAHKKDVKVLLSVGGWTGSRYFSSIVKTKESRAKFIDKMKAIMDQYKLDGIDIDWEYPGRLGIKCNQVDYKMDTPNFIALLKEMRAKFGNKLITLAVRSDPFEINKKPATDLSELAAAVDFINIMAHDINTDWTSTTAPNAPFIHEKGIGVQNSFVQSMEAWKRAKFPTSKIVMGLPFYGKAKKLKSKMAKPSVYQPMLPEIPKGDSLDGLWADPCPGSTKTMSGVWRWKNLRNEGLLSGVNKAGSGWARYWDEKSQTPYLYNDKTLTLITYDDPKSLDKKVDFVKSNNLKGLMFWSLDQDNGELLNAIQKVK